MEEDKQTNRPEVRPAGGRYGKRPAWQWALIYIVVGGAVYWLIYYVVTADSNGGGGLY